MGVEQIDCRNWDEEAYRDSILQEREALSQTIFRTVFAPTRNPNPNSDIIVTSSSDGFVSSYSISSCLALGCGNVRGQNWLVAEPHCLIQGHNGPAYDVKFCGNDEDSLLLSCGDDGKIQGWKWKEILECELPIQGVKLKPVLDLVNPQHKGPWGSLSPIPENNAIAVDSQGGSIYAAAGDSCAYCWDVETSQIKMVFEGHSNYLHCVVARNSCNQIITGSEDGTARIWDCRSGKCIQVIDPGKDKTSKESVQCVSCIALDSSESWLVCGKGPSLSLWNLPVNECISRIRTNSSIQDVVFDENEILAVGAVPLLTRFDMKGDIRSQINCAPQSVFSVSLHPSGVTAVSGYGGLVDIISQFGSHLCTFRGKSL
ncbi:THO complex subunit 6 [Olea europaea subsp. europaea]|uniref:THO complex subunit 6 n=1 Tax=Olea europaea subsp. europaea TaxID=158383 RepID=A0A8S0TQW7_OLEEU|nr:THO complex subunit 6 [Olea europaea subsp. europaea]CAA3008379.1 THO complex subunit 6 [Olea europaea subsp. europaea]